MNILEHMCLDSFMPAIHDEGSLEVKFPTIWTDEKHSQEEAEPGRNSDVEKVRREKVQAREKVGKSRNTVFFSNVLWLRRVEK